MVWVVCIIWGPHTNIRIRKKSWVTKEETVEYLMSKANFSKSRNIIKLYWKVLCYHYCFQNFTSLSLILLYCSLFLPLYTYLICPIPSKIYIGHIIITVIMSVHEKVKIFELMCLGFIQLTHCCKTARCYLNLTLMPLIHYGIYLLLYLMQINTIIT